MTAVLHLNSAAGYYVDSLVVPLFLTTIITSNKYKTLPHLSFILYIRLAIKLCIILKVLGREVTRNEGAHLINELL